MKRPAFVALACIAVASFARGEILEESAYRGAKTTIRYALWGGADEVSQARTRCLAFVKLHPEIRLDVAVYPWGQYWAKLQTQMASGLAPDVMQFFTGSFGVWVSRGALYPLDQLAKQDHYDLGDFFPVTLENCTWNEKLYALPTDIAGWSLIYSRDALEQSGIDKEDWPKANEAMAWDDFIALTRRLTLRNPDGSFAQYGMASTQMWNYTAAGKDGGQYFDRPVNPTRSTALESKGLASALKGYFRSQYGERTTLGAKPLASGQFANNSDVLLLNRKFAMGTTGPWALKQLKDAGLKFGLSPIPKGAHEDALINVNSVAINAKTQHLAEAWEFVKYVTGPESARAVGANLRGIPPRKSAVDAFIHNSLGIEGCEAFIHDLSVASPSVTTDNPAALKVREDWMNSVEETLDAEYDKRLRALPKPISASDYASFCRQMNIFVDQTVDHRLPELDHDLNKALLEAHRKPAGPLQTIVLPLVAVLVMAGAIGFYGLAIARSRSAEVEHAHGAKGGAWFLSPWLVGLVMFVLGPIVAAVALSFTDWNMVSPPNWVGFQNYLDLAGNPKFLIGLKVTFTYALIVIPMSLAAGLFTAGLLASGVKGADFFKAMIYFPALFTGAEAAVLWTSMLNKEHGVLNLVLSWIGLPAVDWMDSGHALLSVIMMNLFWVGGATIIYYAGMKQIPASLYEAAELDGAEAWTKFRRITLPMLSPVILFMVVMTTIGAFQVFTPALFFASSSTDIGGPGDSLRFYAVNIYDAAFNNLKMGQACCQAIVLFLVIFAITYGQLTLSKRFVYSESEA